MHFPTDESTESVGGHGTLRRVWQRFDDGAVAGVAEDRESLPPPETDLTIRALNAPISWNEGRETYRLGRGETEQFIAVAEDELAINVQRLEQVPTQIAEQQQIVDGHDAALAAAHQRVVDIVFVEERAWLEEASLRYKAPAPTMIVSNIELITDDRWLNSRQIRLGATNEWRRKELLEKRKKDATSAEAQALKKLRGLQDMLANLRIQHSLIQNRLYSLRENLAWWERQEEVLDEPPPSSIPRDPALRKHLLELQKSGRLHGTLSFTG